MRHKKINVAITGGGGFIGSYLLKQLKKDKRIKITLFDNSKHTLSDNRTLKSFVKNQDVIFHLAGRIKGQEEEILTLNVIGIFNLLEAIRKFGKNNCKVIFTSSIAVYKPQTTFVRIKESFSCKPISIYGFSKLFSEDLIKFYYSNFGFKSIILRISNVYGFGAKTFYASVVANFIYQIQRGKKITIDGDGTQVRDFIFITDVVDALMKSFKYRPKKVEIFNICSGTRTSINELVLLLEKISKKKAKIFYNKKHKERGIFIGDNNRAQKILHWQSKHTLINGLRKIYNHENSRIDSQLSKS